MEDELTCPVCLELYADPLLLPCTHNLCKKCLTDIIKNTEGGVQCPSCRQPLDVTEETLESLPRNLALENVIFRYSEEKSRALSKNKSNTSSENSVTRNKLADSDYLNTAPEVLCDMCEHSNNKGKAAWTCTKCEVTYCHSCLDRFHPKKGPLAKHKLKPPNSVINTKSNLPKAESCVDHKCEIVTVYCDTCSEMVCPLCLCEDEGQHVGHKILSPDHAERRIQALTKSSKQKLDQQVDCLSSQQARIKALRDETSDIHASTIQRIDNQYKVLVDDISSLLSACKSSAMSKMDSLQETALEQLQACYEKTQTAEEEAEKLILSSDTLSLEGVKIQDAKQIGDLAQKTSTLFENAKNLQESLESAIVGQIEIADVMCKATEDFQARSMKSLQKYVQELTHPAGLPIVPHIISPMSLGQGETTPRVPNKSLITWGFSSTTFTAEKLSSTSMWLVTVEKKAAQWSNASIGYLFGVGVSSKPLSTRELVGMESGNSVGIMCNSGSIFYSNAGIMEALYPVADVPISVELRVSLEEKSKPVLVYKISFPKFGTIMQGRKELPWLPNTDVYPVFTVSQKVKFTFPVSDHLTNV